MNDWIVVALLILAAVAGNGPVQAQEKAEAAKAAAAKAEPVLSSSESIAIEALSEKLQANSQERQRLLQAVAAVETEIRAAFPGYHLDEASGKIQKDPPPAPAAKKAEAQKAPEAAKQ